MPKSGLLVSLSVVLLTAAGAQTPVAPAAQTPPRDAQAPARAGAATLAGRVVTADTGAPIRNALVTIRRATGAAQPQYASTDAEGRYQFDALAPARYSLRVEKLGFVTLEYGQRRPRETGRPVELVAGQSLRGADFTLPKSGVIVVRVTDEAGDPVRNVPIVVLEQQYLPDGQHRLSYTGNKTPSGRTNDLGMTRVWGLPAGEYYVQASIEWLTEVIRPSQSGRTYATTYHPGTLFESDAQPVFLGPGEEIAVDVPLAVSGRPIQISGTVRASDGSVPSSAVVSVTGREVPLQPDGTFVATNVAPAAEQWVSVRPRSFDQPDGEFANYRIGAAETDVSVTITTTRPGTIRGRFRAEDGLLPARGGGSLQLSPASVGDTVVSLSESSWNDDWTFEIRRMLGSYVFRLSSNTGWFLKRVVLNGRDVTDVPIDVAAGIVGPLEVVVTRRSTEIAGRAVDRTSAPVAEYAAILFPEDRAQWTRHSRFIAAARPDLEGQFKVVGLPAGRYRVAAVSSLQPNQERNALFLERLLPRSVNVDLTEGQPALVSVPLSGF